MELESCKVEAIVAVSDMDKAKDFYEESWGCQVGKGGRRYRQR